MAIVRMTQINVIPDNKDAQDHTKKPSYYYKETTSAAGNGDWVLIPNGVEKISVILAAGGVGKIQATNDVAAVNAATTPDDLLDWDNGDISAATESSLVAPVYAIRQVNTSGTNIMTIYAS